MQLTGNFSFLEILVRFLTFLPSANIVVAAKTAEPHAKLPGTIYTAADEIEKAGGKALPLGKVLIFLKVSIFKE